MEEQKYHSERYEKVKFLRNDGFSAVWKYKDKKANKYVAIKTLQIECPSEVLLLKDCHCEFLVKLFTTFYDKNQICWVVKEYCDGGNIKRFAGRWDEEDLIRMTFCILKALKYLHSKDIIHRDVTPENIFWNKQTNVYKLGVSTIDILSLMFPNYWCKLSIKVVLVRVRVA